MRNVRMFYQKTGQAKYISHLDQTRMMTRAMKRAKLPVWYTEGFNPHMFLTFALPLSLGFESEYEIMDFRVTDDTLTDEEIAERIRAVMPPSVAVLRVAAPIADPKAIRFARFRMVLQNEEGLEDFFAREVIVVEKTSKKKKQVTELNVKPNIEELVLSREGYVLTVELTLPAGCEQNINPTLILDAARREKIAFDVCSVVRLALLDEEKKVFA